MDEQALLAKISALPQGEVSAVQRAILRLALLGGLRIGDVLRLRRSDFRVRGYVTVAQGKGSLPLTIPLREDVDFWCDYGQGLGCDLSVYNYISFWRLCRKYGIYFQSTGNVRQSVTHALRHAHAEAIYQASGSVSATAAALGHKSEKSTEFYIEEKRAKKKKSSAGALDAPPNSIGGLVVQKTKSRTIIRLQDVKIKPSELRDL